MLGDQSTRIAALGDVPRADTRMTAGPLAITDRDREQQLPSGRTSETGQGQPIPHGNPAELNPWDAMTQGPQDPQPPAQPSAAPRPHYFQDPDPRGGRSAAASERGDPTMPGTPSRGDPPAQPSAKGSPGKTKGKGSKKGKCYTCGETGHKKGNCPEGKGKGKIPSATAPRAAPYEV